MTTTMLSHRETLTRISDLLTEHVRFEEKELFPALEQRVSDTELNDLAAGRRDV